MGISDACWQMRYDIETTGLDPKYAIAKFELDLEYYCCGEELRDMYDGYTKALEQYRGGALSLKSACEVIAPDFERPTVCPQAIALLKEIRETDPRPGLLRSPRGELIRRISWLQMRVEEAKQIDDETAIKLLLAIDDPDTPNADEELRVLVELVHMDPAQSGLGIEGDNSKEKIPMNMRVGGIRVMLPKNPHIESYLLVLAAEVASDAEGCVERLNGFLHGLWAAELIDTEQRDDLVRIANGG